MAVNPTSIAAAQQLIQLGYSPVAAAGIVGNLVQESGGRLNTRAVHDGGTGIGIAGWRDPSPGQGRKTGLMNFAQQNGADVYDLGTQIKYLDHELRTSEAGVGRRLAQAQTPEQAASAFISFERPAGWSPENPSGGHGYASRVANAHALAGALGGAAPMPLPENNGFTLATSAQAAALPPVDPATMGLAGMFAAPVAAPDPFGTAVSTAFQNVRRSTDDRAAADQARRLALFGMV